MKNFLLLSTFCLLFTINSLATHNRAGEITYRQVSDFTYEITLITYTYTRSDADRDTLEISWGDNTITKVGRISETILPDLFKKNVYRARHTYPGAGTYEIFMLDQNRNAGIENIQGSVNIPFAIKTKLKINAQIGFNNTPILLTEPLDKAAVGKLFIHNPAAWDIDGDSISYKLTTCLGDNGDPIQHYRFPDSENSPIYIDEVTGDLIWDSPTEPGNYNVAFYIEEWRNGIKIGQMLRDMQITVVHTDNMPPEIQELNKYCVEAGQELMFDIKATDSNNDQMKMRAYGGPFEVPLSPATFRIANDEPGAITGRFKWNTICEHVRTAEYQVEFKALDTLSNSLDNVQLVDFEETFIKVVAPAPEIKQLNPTNNTIDVIWQTPSCTGQNLIGYKLYRKIGPSDYEPAHCQTGIPEGLGFELIAEIDDPKANKFVDNNNGNGLKQGQWYCYRLVSKFEGNAESYPSNEVCQKVVRGVPIITNVDVKETDETVGEIFVAWVKPTEHDPVKFPGPYKYIVYRAEGIWGDEFTKLAELDGIDNTQYTDQKLNTADTAYNYKVEFYSGTELVSPPQTASSIFITLKPTNSMDVHMASNVPWIDTLYTVYRKAEGELDFKEVGTTNTKLFKDPDVEYEKEYCYYVKADGYFTVEGIKSPIENHSQETCKKYIDKMPPCPPSLIVDSDCDGEYNILEWEVEELPCNEDIEGFEIYYSSTMDDEPQLIETLFDPSARSWTHYPNGALAGCYQVLSFDYFKNKSEKSIKSCIDKCSKYNLPNAFSPDGDNINDVFHPIPPYYGIKKVDFKVFNRWGKLVFETNDPDINWDGRDQTTKQIVSNGVYFYTCTVYEPRLTGVEDRHISGFIQVVARSKVIQN